MSTLEVDSKDVIKLILVMLGVDVGRAADPNEPAPGQPDLPQATNVQPVTSQQTGQSIPSAPPLPENQDLSKFPNSGNY